MRARKAIRTIVEMEMDSPDAEMLCADILFLLEATKDIAGMVPGASVTSAIECRERLEKFQRELRGALK